MVQEQQVRDRLGRPVTDLRLSVTDRCNLRCRYCMPRERFGPADDGAVGSRSASALTTEERLRVVRAMTRLGVTTVRLTGGEPLLDPELSELVSGLRPVVDDVAMTTNGVLLPGMASALAVAGLDRVTVSLDALDDVTFRSMADTRLPVARVLDGIDAARSAGLSVKVNTVLRRGANDGQLEELAAWARREGLTLRFIEFMDVGTTNGWRVQEVVPAEEVVGRLAARWSLAPVPPSRPGEVAERYRYLDGGGEVGVIASVTRPFCRTCVRARLAADGELFTCLFAARGRRLGELVRAGADERALAAVIASLWRGRDDRASELRGPRGLSGPRVEMSYIGG